MFNGYDWVSAFTSPARCSCRRGACDLAGVRDALDRVDETGGDREARAGPVAAVFDRRAGVVGDHERRARGRGKAVQFAPASNE